MQLCIVVGPLWTGVCDIKSESGCLRYQECRGSSQSVDLKDWGEREVKLWLNESGQWGMAEVEGRAGAVYANMS